MISVIIAPASSPQVATAKPSVPNNPRLDELDERLLETVRDSGLTNVWSILNIVCNEEAPQSRGEGRTIRLRLLNKVQRLHRLGLLFLVGRNSVSPVKPDPTTDRQIIGRRRRTVRKSHPFRPVSAPIEPSQTMKVKPQFPLLSEGDRVNRLVMDSAQHPEKTKSADNGEQVSKAARSLARLTRKKRARRWTGWLGNIHLWRGAQVTLPTGRIAHVYGAIRGNIIVLKPPEDESFPPLELYQASQVRLLKNSDAVRLGAQKRGKKERKSTKKLLSCRRNGHQPARPGRRRGRPKTLW